MIHYFQVLPCLIIYLIELFIYSGKCIILIYSSSLLFTHLDSTITSLLITFLTLISCLSCHIVFFITLTRCHMYDRSCEIKDLFVRCSIYFDDVKLKPTKRETFSRRSSSLDFLACLSLPRLPLLTNLSLTSLLWDIGKQNSPRCDAAELGVPSEAFLFA